MLDSFNYNYYLNVNTFGFYKKRAGISFTVNLIGGRYAKRFLKPYRYKSYGSGDSVVRLILLTPFLILSLCMFINVWIFIEELFLGGDWLSYLKVIGWLFLINFLVVNMVPYLSTLVKGKYVYFDREKQKVSFTFEIPHCTERDEFGNCCFDYSEINLRYQRVYTNEYGAMTYAPIISHKDGQKFPKAKITAIINENGRTPIECLMLFEDIRRFMDKSKPLPESPEYEGFRHLDPVTAEHDKVIGRPASYWSEMSLEQQLEIANKIYEPIYELNEEFPKKPLPEMKEPWKHWKSDGKKGEGEGLKHEILLIAMQLFTAKPM
ncbi:hypothetical protein DS891_08045 [Pseudoalteromonas sp. JC28]|uniref:hypothetical protein n=1 Tax=Pseudoalteromonas sp. JC28 TaxID=2267617 RepID=UPI001574CCF2|nr:hypothetical protein [Pseudoalteromonas sp. JC28]NSY33545.1 hypothetical protein [Pseudoalteromonas sp. JC28]